VEAYACPFTGHVYLTASAWSGPYKDHEKIRRCILFCSTDAGQIWDIIKEDFDANTPLIMTSTPNGRLFLFYSDGNNNPVVYFSKNTVKSGVKPDISPGYAVYYKENGKKVPRNGDNEVDMELKLPTPAISRISTEDKSSKVRLAYQSVNQFGRQEARVISVNVQNPNQPPIFKNVRTIKAINNADYSVMYFTFIDPDYIDMPANAKSNTSVLYWLEAPKEGITKKSYSARYMIFEGDYNTSCPEYLSIKKDGSARSWSARKNPGDYMTGGFYWKDNRLKYFAQWVEPDGIKANIVSLTYQRPSGNPSMTCTAVWQRNSIDEIQIYDWKYEDFRRKYDELWTQGWRLYILNNYVVNNVVRYTAVWRKSSEPEIQVYGWTYEEYRKKYDEIWCNGWRLKIFNAW
jgi:hypothetical protein